MMLEEDRPGWIPKREGSGPDSSPLAGDKAIGMVPGGIMLAKDTCHDAR